MVKHVGYDGRLAGASIELSMAHICALTEVHQNVAFGYGTGTAAGWHY